VRILAKWPPGICVRPTSRGGSNVNSERLEKCALLLPRRTKVLYMSFSPLGIPWTKNFGCKVTFLGLLNFLASHWLKFSSSRLLASSVKRPLIVQCCPNQVLVTLNRIPVSTHGTVLSKISCEENGSKNILHFRAEFHHPP
jgi:hypothetical protein